MDEFYKEKEFCEKWLPMLERVEQDEVFKKSLMKSHLDDEM